MTCGGGARRWVTERLYRVHHRGSQFRGRIVRLLIRPSPRRRPNNVLAEVVATGERFICPWRGLRRTKGVEH